MREEDMTPAMRRLMDVLCYLLLFFFVLLLAWLVLPPTKEKMTADYLNAFIGAVFGAVFSIALAYAIYSAERRRERQAARVALIDGLRFNDDRAVQMLGQFAAGIAPNYQFDTTGLIVWLSKSAGLFDEVLLATDQLASISDGSRQYTIGHLLRLRSHSWR